MKFIYDKNATIKFEFYTLNPFKNNTIKKIACCWHAACKMIGAMYQAYSHQKPLTLTPKLTIRF